MTAIFTTPPTARVWLVGLAWAWLAALAHAQNPAPAAAPVPGSVPGPVAPEGAALAVPYTSVFAHYQGYADQSVSDWKTTNDTVGRIGGWRAYAKEAREPDASQAPGTGAHSQHGSKP